MATCDKYRDIGKHVKPGAIVLTCRRKPLHTGKHITPDGMTQWWGPADNDELPTKSCKECGKALPMEMFYRFPNGRHMNTCMPCDSARKSEARAETQRRLDEQYRKK